MCENGFQVKSVKQKASDQEYITLQQVLSAQSLPGN
jgi:hypothetical protein